MEKFEARTAFKSSFLSEISMEVCLEEVRAIGNVTCEDFSVDDLLDFSDKDFEEGSFQESEQDYEANKASFNCNLSDVNLCNNDNGVVFGDLPTGGLSVPVDEMENLEWLSQIVDDSSTEVSLLCPVRHINWTTGSFLKNRCEPVSKPVVPRVKEPCFPLPLCRKPRAKRQRPNGRAIWAIGSSPSLTPESSSLTSNSLEGSSSRISSLLVDGLVQQGEWFVSARKPVAKKQKKNNAEENGPVSSGTQMVHRCTHCQVQKTPQWRAGPLGPKTLCNACGVRYKSGRLFPEYRPACSPTFSREVHSNSHRKVLEMRRQKEVVGVIETGLSPMVQSF
ncbi:zinc finger transcription factor [Lithospermum erythrorhizon]|uniref:GATA transcription factor n=1 Tax=Lithospermum erythrorhizon TaxID=34254 RepID=A0AAV3NWS7_LITER